MPEKRLSVLIGIPSFRRPEGLRKLLNSLAAQQGADHVAAAVFVADNDPEQHQAHDLAVALAPAFRWPLTSEVVEEPGISAARNAILDQAREASVNFIAMLDDDEVAEPNWLIELLDCQRRYDADVVGGPVDFDFEAQPSTSIRNCGIFDVPSWKEGLVPLLYASGSSEGLGRLSLHSARRCDLLWGHAKLVGRRQTRLHRSLSCRFVTDGRVCC